MSNLAIEEKIKKIRQDLYNFNLGGQGSLEKYLEDNRELQYSELESILKSDSPEGQKSLLKGSQSAEDLNSHEDLDKSPRVIKYNPESTANYNEFTLNRNQNLSIKEIELVKQNQSLQVSLNESRSKYLKMLADKDERISYLEHKLKRTESELMYLNQGKNNMEELKSSTRDLKHKAEELDSERVSLAKENFQLQQRLLEIQKELTAIETHSFGAIEENKKLKAENFKYSKKLEEMNRENDMLYKNLNSHKPNPHRSSSSCISPKKLKSPRFTRKASLSESSKKNVSEDEKTERKGRSPSVKSRTSKIPRPKSKSKDLRLDFSHSVTCKLIKQIMLLFSADSPNLLLPLIKSSIQDNKSLTHYKDFLQKVQVMITSNSPPNTFKTPPGTKACLKWIKRLVKEYLQLKKSSNNSIEKKILDVLKSGLNSNTYEDIVKSISKLLVENERLLTILSKVKKGYSMNNAASLEDLEREIEIRTKFKINET